MKAKLTENDVIEVGHIDHNNYKAYIGKTVKVTGNVLLRGLGLTKIPINFTEVDGNFYCSENQLTSLVGAPKIVGRSFDCSFNQLTDLKGAPEKVGVNFECVKNQLASYKGRPKFIGGEFIS